MRKKGIILISTMLLLTVIVMLGIMLSITGFNNMKASRTFSEARQAEYAALSGLEYVKYKLSQNSDFMSSSRKLAGGSIDVEDVFVSHLTPDSQNKLSVTTNYDEQIIVGTFFQNGKKTSSFVIGFADTNNFHSNALKIWDSKQIKYLSCNNILSDKPAQLLSNDKGFYKPRKDPRGSILTVPSGKAYIAVMGIANKSKRYGEAYIDAYEILQTPASVGETITANFSGNNQKFKLSHKGRFLSGAANNYASTVHGSFIDAPLSYLEEEASNGKLRKTDSELSINWNNLEKKQTGFNIPSGAYIYINDKWLYFSDFNCQTPDKLRVNSKTARAMPSQQSLLFKNGVPIIEAAQSCVVNGDFLAACAEKINSNGDVIFSGKKDVTLVFRKGSDARVFVNGSNCTIKGRVCGDGMLYCSGKISIRSSDLLKEKYSGRPFIAAKGDINVEKSKREYMAPGFSEYLSALWTKSYYRLQEQQIRYNDQRKLADSLLKSSANFRGKNLILRDALEKECCRMTEEEAKFFVLELIDKNSKLSTPKHLASATDRAPYFILNDKLDLKEPPYSDDAIIEADLASKNGSLKISPDIKKIYILGFAELNDSNLNKNKDLFFNYIYDPEAKIFLFENMGTNSKYVGRGLFLSD